jgi:uncharacterized membrane protein
VRLEKQTHEAYGLERLFVVSRGRQLPLASFLSPDDKSAFADALGRALGEARRGVTRTVL